jgi:hypothetical protein
LCMQSMKGAMHKLTDDWTWRRGQWNSRSWSVFGADSKVHATKPHKLVLARASRQWTENFLVVCLCRRIHCGLGGKVKV